MEVIFNDEISVSELNSAAILVARICDLIVSVSFLCVKSEVLGQIKQEWGVIAGCGELGRPSMRGIPSNDEPGIPVILPAHRSVLVIWVHFQYNNVRLSDQVLLVFECLQHRLDWMTVRPDVSFGIDFYRLNPLFDDRIVRKVEVQDNLYIDNIITKCDNLL